MASGAILLVGGTVSATIAGIIGAAVGGIAVKEVLDEVTSTPHTEDFARSLEAAASSSGCAPPTRNVNAPPRPSSRKAAVSTSTPTCIDSSGSSKTMDDTTKQNLDREALRMHAQGRPGKFEIHATKPLITQRDLSLAYSPGVAAPCLEIARTRTWPTT